MKKFKTESQKLLDMVINSIYTNKDIFLRELISNSSDAIDKLYFKSLTDKKTKVNSKDFAIRIEFDKNERTIKVSDNGIGMTKDELDKNLGTIAHSDSHIFKTESKEEKAKDVDIIGQFGVGFYSCFMVAKNVQVISKAYGSDEAFMWESDGTKGYNITPSERSENGTSVILYIKDNTDEVDYDLFLTDYKLTEIIRKYSNYIRYPIIMEITKSRQLPLSKEAGTLAKPEWENVTEYVTINSMTPLWKKRKGEVDEEEYKQFYKREFSDTANPFLTISFHAEGNMNYDVLLFVPNKLDKDKALQGNIHGVQLFSSNVLIQEKCRELLPDCYSFVVGIVDSQDLPLNISREILQRDYQLQAMKRRIEKKVKAELIKKMKEDRAKYEKFHAEFSPIMKYGICQSRGAGRELVEDLFLFDSAKEERLVSFEEYVETMLPEQDAIYYCTGTNISHLRKMPVVKGLVDRGYDVLLGLDGIDDICFTTLATYGNKALKNATSVSSDVATEDEKKVARKTGSSNKELLNLIKDMLAKDVVKVEISTRLTKKTDMPACLITENSVGFGLEAMMQNMPNAPQMPEKHVLELNPNHPVFGVLKKAFEKDDKKKIRDYSRLLVDQCMLVEGMPLEDPLTFAENITKLMK